ncbi:hypothetical protein ACS2BX_26080 [Bacillus cereus group sp. BceL300]|uniref:hypothetical protein n=1 Tax=Bacillus cereus group TaxID=86661 RepID=UPI0014440C85|nr:hypothetical protein [Bacillus cereus]NKW77453.1 hypothetical protein [Bacillus cereus]NKX14871.1 hypothetical protein [Bacillus cereus]
MVTISVADHVKEAANVLHSELGDEIFRMDPHQVSESMYTMGYEIEAVWFLGYDKNDELVVIEEKFNAIIDYLRTQKAKKTL